MRTTITLLALMVFGLSHVIYLYSFHYKLMDIHYLKGWSALNIGLLGLFAAVDAHIGYRTYLHRQFNLICKYSSSITMFIISANHYQLLKDKESIMYSLKTFIGSILAVSAVVFISGIRHGIFKQNTENAI